MQHLQHTLKNRHIQMIALGGAIGTGLFLGSASAIKMTGPSIILAYILGGLIIYGVMRALGEMTVDHPTPGSFMEYAKQNLGSGAGFIIGWNTWLLFTVACMLEVSAASTLLDFWIYIPHWITCLVLLCILGGVNLIGVKYFGETEFWFAGIKIAVITFMILVCLYMLIFDHTVQVIVSNNVHAYQNPSVFFSNGLNGFLVSMAVVVLSFGGSEFVSVAAGEAEDAHKSIPKAITGVVIRIILFYVLTISIIVFIYPFHQISSSANPFADVFTKLGFSKSAEVINFLAITATLSALNSCLYVATRFLYSLSKDNMAPKCFSILGRTSVPSTATMFTVVISFIVVIANYIVPAKIMNYLFSLISTGFIINWYIILLSHIMFRKRMKKNGKYITYKMPGYPYINIIIMVVLFIIMVGMAKNPEMVISIYIAPAWIFILSIVYALNNKKIKSSNN